MKLGFYLVQVPKLDMVYHPEANLPLIFLDMTPVKVKKHLKR